MTLTGLPQSHICVCPKPGPEFQTPYSEVFFCLCSLILGEMCLLVLFIIKPTKDILQIQMCSW